MSSKEGDQMENEMELLTATQVSRLTGIAVSSLHEAAVRAELGMPVSAPPHLRLGPRRRRWLAADVQQWILECRVAGPVRK